MDSLKVLLFFFFGSTGLQEIDVDPDGNVNLECYGPEKGNLILLEWKRYDLLLDGYVFFYRDDRPHKNFQHPIFKDRVKLRDPQMKNMDMSIILSNTTINDTGTYECRIIVGDTGDRSSTTSEIKHKIRLKVRQPGQPRKPKKDTGKQEEARFTVGFIGLLIALGFSAVSLAVLHIASCFLRRAIALLKKQKKENSPASAAPDEEVCLTQKTK